MGNNKFFVLVWRINGILILGGVVIISLFIMYQITKDLLRSNNRSQANIIESVAEDPHNKEKWVLGSPSNIDGNDFIMIPLVSENKEVKMKKNSEFSKSYYKKSISKPTKNILFLDTKNNKSFWLFNDTKRLIINTRQFPDSYKSKGPTNSIFYNVVSKDSNNDNILDYKDNASLFISSPKGSKYKLVLKAYDRIISKSMVGKNDIMIVYQFEGVAYSMLIQLSPFDIKSNEKLPKIKS